MTKCLSGEEEFEYGYNHNGESLINELKAWALEFQIPKTAFSELLLILRKNGHCDLPKDTPVYMK